MPHTPVLVWFRRDLRLSDNPAYAAAVRSRRPVVPVFIHAPDDEKPWPPGAASRWWMHHSAAALNKSLTRAGSRLIIRRGPPDAAIRDLLKQTGADTVYWNRLYDPALIPRDADLERDLRHDGVTVSTFNSALIFEPWELHNKSGNPFQVFTPFWKASLARAEPPAPLPRPRKPAAPPAWPRSEPLSALNLLPDIQWDTGLHEVWTPGEKGASDQLETFLDEIMVSYKEARDRPGVAGTSRLSPHLHAGDISPRQVWHAAQHTLAAQNTRGLVAGAECFLREIGWREFAYHLLYHFPHTPEKPLRDEFNDFPWRDDANGLQAWQKGLTGFPVVDAGMRELWHTGWMHNRVRMIAASFLVKDLLIPWQHGARWFWDTLVDADLASNTLGWQWVSGCGADAAPYFRIFNPTLQGRKFDADGTYVRRWIPELARLPDTDLQAPSEADPGILEKAGVTLGATYPEPIVDHKAARNRALAALAEIKKEG